MKPTLLQLESWLQFHSIEYMALTDHIMLCAYVKGTDEVIANVTVPGIISERDSMLKACNNMAHQLCILNPQVANTLNHPHYR